MDLQALFRQAAGYFQSGNPAEAERICLQLLTDEPANFNALNMLGALRSLQGRKSEALALVAAAVKANPDSAPALLHQGTLLAELGRQEDALASYDAALAIRPDLATALYNRGNILLDMERLDAGLASYDAAVAIQPDYFEALNNRGAILRQMGRLDEALASYAGALAIRPDDAALLGNCGNVLREMNRLDEALAYYDKAVARDPHRAGAWDDRGVTLRELGRFDEALESFDRAIAADPHSARPCLHKSLCALQLGMFAEGWRLLERRKEIFTWGSLRNYPQPAWSGEEDIRGKSLFIHWEEGLGDTIQFYRYAALARARGATVIMSVPDSLMRLLQDADPHIEIIAADATPPEFDYHIALLSLPLAFGTDRGNIPAAVPYLRAQTARVTDWGKKIGSWGFKIGIAWQGLKRPGLAANRSFALVQLEGVAGIPNVRLISLQKNDGVEQLESLPSGMQVETLPHLDLGPDAFLDTAAVMENLDLVITADTAIAHLAGALGRPSWVALNYVADWRWFQERTDSPWYPGMRLFRQDRTREWQGVFTKMQNQLVAAQPPAL